MYTGIRKYGPPKTIYNRFIRWSAMGGDGKGSGDARHRWKAIGEVFNKVFAGLAAKAGKPDQLMIDAFPKAKSLLDDTEHRAVPGAREDAQDMMPTGSATHSHPLRPMGTHLHGCHLQPSKHHLLDQSMSPDPKSFIIMAAGNRACYCHIHCYIPQSTENIREGFNRDEQAKRLNWHAHCDTDWGN